jgi:hypothetical protein
VVLSLKRSVQPIVPLGTFRRDQSSIPAVQQASGQGLRLCATLFLVGKWILPKMALLRALVTHTTSSARSSVRQDMRCLVIQSGSVKPMEVGLVQQPRAILSHALSCPAPHMARLCAQVVSTITRALLDATQDTIRQAVPVASASPRRVGPEVIPRAQLWTVERSTRLRTVERHVQAQSLVTAVSLVVRMGTVSLAVHLENVKQAVDGVAHRPNAKSRIVGH